MSAPTSPEPTDTPPAAAIPPGLRASVIDNLLAAIPPPPDSDAADRLAHETMLIAHLDELRPRDLEETLLAVEFLVAHHTSMRCFAEAGRRKPGGRKASRLCRDGIALQRAAQAAHRALQKSQRRPMLRDAADQAPRPTVPTVMPKPVAAKPADRAAAKAAAEAKVDTPPKPNKNPFEGQPDLQALSDRWHDLPPWEEMTMEERRKTFGYTYTRKPAAAAGEGDAGAAA
jgi:hypothetical protein